MDKQQDQVDNQNQGESEGELTPESIAVMSHEDKVNALAQVDSDIDGADELDQLTSQDDSFQGDDDVNATAEQKRIAELENQLRETQLKFDRQGNEVGELRNHLKSQKEMLIQSLEDDRENGFSKLTDDPFGAMREHENKQAQLQDIENQERMLEYQQNAQATKQLIASRMGDNAEELVDDVKEMLREDGVSEEDLQRINPFGMSRDTAYNLFQRAKLAKENRLLREQMQKSQGNQGDILSKIDKVARTGGRVAGRSGHSVADNGELTPEKVAMMSTDEKRKMLAKLNSLS